MRQVVVIATETMKRLQLLGDFVPHSTADRYRNSTPDPVESTSFPESLLFGPPR